ncbi:MAG: hypothetical protein HY075_14690 [Deltaproteobacteria bacterium]|nr:hypothetical protein [Deltaproteobacteria bacterium]
MLSELKGFFESGALAQKAADSIRNGREIGLEITAPSGSTHYTFTKESGRNVLREGKSSSPDVAFVIPDAAARDLVTRNFETVGQVGLHIFEKILSNDPSQKIQIRLRTGVLSLVTGGYFGVLTAGGSEVARFMATKGLGSMGKLKDAISKLKG